MAAGEHSMAESGDVDPNAENASETTPVVETYTLPVLQLVKEAQQQHGLRHGDHQRYHGYCTRRLRRIRKSLHFPQGTKHRVQPKKITHEHVNDIRYLHLPLFCAERSWTHAMQLKSEANTEPRKKFHMLSRLKKAVVYADELNALCQSERCDARTKLEAQAFCDWMHGSVEFESQHWKSAIEYFNSAKTIYDKLGVAFTEEVRALYQQRVDEIVPNLRYCSYNIGDESAFDDLVQMRIKGGDDDLTMKLDELIAQTREKQASTFSEFTWRGRKIPVNNEHIRAFLLMVRESEKEIEEASDIESKVSIHESLLQECIDALQIIREDLKNDPVFKALQRGQQVEGKVSNVQYLYTYLQYVKLTKTIQRNLLMISSLKANLPGVGPEEGKKTKPQDLARLYDIITQNLSEIPSLPGLGEDPTIEGEINTQTVGYKALRCFYIAKTYSMAKKWREAIALYEKVTEYAEEAIGKFKRYTGDQKEAKEMIASLQDLAQEVDGLKYSSHASSILDSENMTEAVVALKNNKPLMDRLEQYHEDSGLTSKAPNLTSFPPEFQPVPCKPLFFDLALNHVEFPSLEDRAEQSKAGGGITGLVKGWLWGGKK